MACQTRHVVQHQGRFQFAIHVTVCKHFANHAFAGTVYFLRCLRQHIRFVNTHDQTITLCCCRINVFYAKFHVANLIKMFSELSRFLDAIPS